jgi:hypothetical protein
LPKAYSMQIFLIVRHDAISMELVSGYDKKISLKKHSIKIPTDLIRDGMLTDQKAWLALLRSGLKAMKIKKDAYKLVFIMKCLPTLKIDITKGPHVDILIEAERALQEHSNVGLNDVLYQILPVAHTQANQEQYAVFVTRIDLLSAYRSAAYELDISIGLLEFRMPCLLSLLRTVPTDTQDFVALLNWNDDGLQSLFLEGNKIISFHEEKSVTPKGIEMSRDQIFTEIDTAFEFMKHRYKKARNVDGIYVNSGKELIQAYLETRGYAKGANVVQPTALKSVYVDESERSSLGSIAQGVHTDRSPSLSFSSAEDTQAGEFTSSGTRTQFMLQVAMDNGKGDAPPPKKAVAPPRFKLTKLQWALGLTLLLALVPYLYKPGNEELVEVKANAFDDPYLQLGLPKDQKNLYPRILTVLQKEKAEKAAAGTELTDLKKKQLEFLEAEKAKNAF